jgi:predicted DNA-binding transcriptional regulator AlpA
MGEKLISPEDLAEREGVPLGTVYQWNSRGDGPPYMRIGRFVRYRLADILTWENGRYVERDDGRGPEAA